MALRLSNGLDITLLPLCAREFVEAVWPQRVALRDGRMLKVLVRVGHADSLHDCDRGQICERGEGHDLLQTQTFKADA